MENFKITKPKLPRKLKKKYKKEGRIVLNVKYRPASYVRNINITMGFSKPIP